MSRHGHPKVLYLALQATARPRPLSGRVAFGLHGNQLMAGLATGTLSDVLGD
jgi:hypothetical protein